MSKYGLQLKEHVEKPRGRGFAVRPQQEALPHALVGQVLLQRRLLALVLYLGKICASALTGRFASVTKKCDPGLRRGILPECEYQSITCSL